MLCLAGLSMFLMLLWPFLNLLAPLKLLVSYKSWQTWLPFEGESHLASYLQCIRTKSLPTTFPLIYLNIRNAMLYTVIYGVKSIATYDQCDSLLHVITLNHCKWQGGWLLHVGIYISMNYSHCPLFIWTFLIDASSVQHWTTLTQCGCNSGDGRNVWINVNVTWRFKSSTVRHSIRTISKLNQCFELPGMRCFYLLESRGKGQNVSWASLWQKRGRRRLK